MKHAKKINNLYRAGIDVIDGWWTRTGKWSEFS